MKLYKRVLRNHAVRGVLCALAALYIKLVHVTGRWPVEHGEVPQELWRGERPFILAFWHGRLMMMPYCWRHGTTIKNVISHHPDGQFLARTMGYFGFGSITGSTGRGGEVALRGILKVLKRGECIGITPDGPRGPRMRASEGVVDIARLSGAPIVPAAFATSRRRVLGTWDRFVLALPFSRGVFVWGAAITVPRAADGAAREAARLALEERLNAVTREADGRVGQDTIEPAPAASVSASAP